MIEAILKNITDGQALLEVATGEQITIAAGILPANISVGDIVIVEILSKEAFLAKQNQDTKDTLNELLQA